MSVATLLFLAAVAPVSLALGLWTLRAGSWYSDPPAAEIVISRIGSVTLSARTATDRRFARFHAWTAVVPGALFPPCFTAVSVSLLSE